MKLKRIITTLTFFFSLTAFAQQKKDTSNYVLVGKIEDFKLLFAIVTAPDDVTTNQKKAVAEWINKGLQILTPKTDSTTIQKKPK